MSVTRSEKDRPESATISRRAFLKSTGLAVVGATAVKTGPTTLRVSAAIVMTSTRAAIVGPSAVAIALNVNGIEHFVSVEPSMTLVEVLSSVQDIGTGISTVLSQVVAEELDLRPEDISVRIGDTDFPSGPPSYGTMTTASITPPARNAARQVLATLLDAAPLVVGAARHAAQVALTGSTPLAKHAYKVPVFEALARRAIIDAGSPT